MENVYKKQKERGVFVWGVFYDKVPFSLTVIFYNWGSKKEEHLWAKKCM